MKLRRLQIERLPGITTRFELSDFAAGLNVVLGPNASGKSSICRAVRALLYGEDQQGPVDLEAEFEDAEGTLKVVFQGTKPRWYRDGQETERPPLPDARLISCFTVQIDDLLSEGDTEDEIRARIAKILAGGYDVDAVRQLDRFHTRPQHAKKEASELREAERALREARAQHEELQAQEKRLDELRERKEEAAREAARIVSLDTALELLQHRLEAAAIDRELSEFSPDMERLTGEEAKRLAELRSVLEAQRLRLQEIGAEAVTAEEKQQRSALDEHEPTPAALEERRLTLSELRTIERDRRNADEALTDARAALDVAIRELGGEAPPEETRVTPDSVSKADQGLRDKRKLDARERALEEQIALLESAEVDDAGLERRRQARAALAQWLASPDWSTAPRLVHWPWVLLIVLASLGGIVIAAWRVHWALAGLSLLVLGAGAALLRRPAPPADRRGEARSVFLNHGMDDLAEWSEESVQRRIGELEIEIIGCERARDESRRRKQLERTLESTRAQTATAIDELRVLAGELGFDPRLLDDSFDRWVHILDAYENARRKVAALEARQAGLAESEERLRSDLIEFLARFAESPGDATAGAEQLESALRRLETRRGAQDDARTTLARTEREQKTVRAEQMRIEKAITAVYTEAGLAESDDAELVRRLELRDDWKSVHNRRRGKIDVLLNAEQRLGDEGDLLALVKAKDESTLRRQRDAARELAGEQESISNEIVKIETSITQARAGNELDVARARHAGCREILEQQFEQECFSTAARLLLDDVEQQHVDANRPEVLRRAEEWFARFTRNAFTLRSHAPRGGTFLARENSSGEDRTPRQLSSGTRMQLFLALRLAFALDAERDREPLPFFLDEALTISDPERSGSIVDCLHAFAREQNRQLFYLTAQPHDLRMWSGLDPQPKQIKLHEVRRLTASLQEPGDLELRRLEEIPAGTGLTPEQYGELLQVPRLELWEAATMVHLFHLLRDELALLEKLLNLGIRTVGQLRGLLDSGYASVHLSPGELENLRWRAALVDAFLEACRHGRGRPVNRQVLEQAELRSTYIDRFASLADDLGGDARALLDAVDAKADERVKRFRADQRELLEAYFETNGHLGTGLTLEAREIELRVQSAANTDVERGTTTRNKVAEVTRFLLATVPVD